MEHKKNEPWTGDVVKQKSTCLASTNSSNHSTVQTSTVKKKKKGKKSGAI
jgi:hypothetical protein